MTVADPSTIKPALAGAGAAAPIGDMIAATWGFDPVMASWGLFGYLLTEGLSDADDGPPAGIDCAINRLGLSDRMGMALRVCVLGVFAATLASGFAGLVYDLLMDLAAHYDVPVRGDVVVLRMAAMTLGASVKFLPLLLRLARLRIKGAA